jgi:hypothetical protein
VPLVLVATAGLTACGGDDSGSNASDQPGATGSPTAGATDSLTASATDAVTDATDSASQSATTGSSGSGGGDACRLLTTDQVAAAVGSPVKDGLPSSGPAVTGGSFTSCVWQSADPDNPADTATVTVYPNTDAADSAREDDSQDVPGIGDKAFSASFGSMWVYVGEKSFFAQWYTFSGSDEENLPKSQALAQAVAGAL